MKTEIILSPRFTGDRFVNHTLPIALFKDLEALQGVISEIARDAFIRAHPGRRRLPRGFNDALALHLAKTEDGSFIPHLAVLVSSTLVGEPPELTAARSARDLFIDAVGQAQSEGGSPPSLPAAAWPYIERFGRGLHDGEAIVLTEAQGRKIELTKEVRRRLLLARAGAQALTDEVTVVARIEGVQRTMITLALHDDRIVPAPLTDAHFHELEELRVGDFRSTWLQVDGVGLFDRAGQLQRLDEVQKIDILDAEDPSVQLERLKSMKDGWLDGRGKAPTDATLKRIREWFDETLTDRIPLPRLFPTPEGGVESEWLIGRLDISLEFDPQAQRVEWHALNLDTQELDERSAPLHDHEALRDLGTHMALCFEQLRSARGLDET